MRETPSQTAGPYLHIGLAPEGRASFGRDLRAPGVRGEAMELGGTVRDGAGEPCGDALIELWQPDAAGRFPGTPGADSAFGGYGRCACDAAGRYRFETIRPGAPFVSLLVFARGINAALHTRAYLEPAEDDVLRAAGDRAGTLMAAWDGATARFDIRLQGTGETVFLDF
ncbi:protocatechuate 3,4-dioxygenase alpha subunit [Hasllibacter halocynthiae]|uniref:Protocatechuate 3,4-dioxygenase alpha subunit n=1 Tax=Hasllibacter halocynthiae TaxID=595589 RepID=A0A2T0X6W4_9RHOB|nr:protocatechuate 3,4-dioxygenase subunit alpha [Hasllibacter halocynthiae]PRY94614.1 protocatechuate 3,4-dioxygenase alpha subunit [Hasllibacter halocynthiae]